MENEADFDLHQNLDRNCFPIGTFASALKQQSLQNVIVDNDYERGIDWYSAFFELPASVSNRTLLIERLSAIVLHIPYPVEGRAWRIVEAVTIIAANRVAATIKVDVQELNA